MVVLWDHRLALNVMFEIRQCWVSYDDTDSLWPSTDTRWSVATRLQSFPGSKFCIFLREGKVRRGSKVFHSTIQACLVIENRLGLVIWRDRSDPWACDYASLPATL